MSAIEEQIYQVRNQSNQDPLNFPIKINNRIASLLRVVNTGDGKPIGNASPIFADLSAELKTQTDRLQEIRSGMSVRSMNNSSGCNSRRSSCRSRYLSAARNPQPAADRGLRMRLCYPSDA